MGQPAANQGDRVVAVDTHSVIVPGAGPVPMPHPFTGIIDGGLSNNVNIMGRPAATAGSTATNTPPHVPAGGTGFLIPPTNRGTIQIGSPTVKINGKMAARNGDVALTCNDPVELPVGQVIAFGTVMIG
jgi:uncharacterized Zn-binding protein involved in type VI secretion